MTIQLKISQALQKILSAGGNEKTPSLISEASLKNFMTAYGDEAFAFFPTHPSLPEAKYLLWNYENLRPELKTIFQHKILALWNLTEPASEVEIASKQPSTADFPNTLEEKKPAVEPEPAIHFRESKMTHCSGITRKQDAFDQFLDYVGVLVRAVTFS